MLIYCPIRIRIFKKYLVKVSTNITEGLRCFFLYLYFMIRVEISDREYKIPSKHSEITGRQLHSIKEDKPKDIIKALTSITHDIVDKLSHQAVMQLYGILDFIYEVPDKACI